MTPAFYGAIKDRITQGLAHHASSTATEVHEGRLAPAIAVSRQEGYAECAVAIAQGLLPDEVDRLDVARRAQQSVEVLKMARDRRTAA
ncbi:hypothetical protein [Ottowia sp.]|uniref:hypothetical protein n=1 Tax=Ottowia sp. TaxID=1898956 RepID=UPI0025F22E22|nr:hypothetical protein [Ottowia sp.]MBK6616082.1 hypothetical protein [Ottowia sp.]